MATRSTGQSLASDIGGLNYTKKYEDNPYSSPRTNTIMRIARASDGLTLGNTAYDARGNRVGFIREDGTIDSSVAVPQQSPKEFAATDKAIKAMAGSFVALDKGMRVGTPLELQKLAVKLANDSQKVLRSLGYGLDTVSWNDPQSASDFIARVNRDGFTYAKEALRNYFWSQATGHAAYGREIYDEQEKSVTLASGAGSASDPEGNVEIYESTINNPKARAEYESTVRQQKKFNNYRGMVKED
jgi:hypothetical protein